MPSVILLAALLAAILAASVVVRRDILAAVRKLADGGNDRFLELAPDAVVVVNSEGRIAVVNARTEALFGYSRSQLIGQNVSTLLPRRFRETHGAHLLGYFRDPKARAMGTGIELYGARADGSEVRVEIMLAPIVTAAGTLAMAVVRDVSERLRVEAMRAELARATRLTERDWQEAAREAGWTAPRDG
jgi:protein-histidine pros-kinase